MLRCFDITSTYTYIYFSFVSWSFFLRFYLRVANYRTKLRWKWMAKRFQTGSSNIPSANSETLRHHLSTLFRPAYYLWKQSYFLSAITIHQPHLLTLKEGQKNPLKMHKGANKNSFRTPYPFKTPFHPEYICKMAIHILNAQSHCSQFDRPIAANAIYSIQNDWLGY